jgi:hypothetical protein
MRLDPKAQTMELSVLYVGAKGAGKRSNLHQMAAIYGPMAGPMLDVSDADSAESGSFLQIDLGHISGFKTAAACATVSTDALERGEGPGMLARADALVLVIDSRPERLGENKRMLKALAKALDKLRASLGEIPTLYQWNHQDAPGALTPSELAQELDPARAPGVVGLARDGAGVWETHIETIKAALSSVWLRAARPSERSANREKARA